MTLTELQILQTSVAQQFAAKQWRYADKDPAARAVMKDELEARARRMRSVSYINISHNVDFHLPNINGGAIYHTGVPTWIQLDASITGDFHCYNSMESFIDHGYLLSVLVVETDSRRPSFGFYDLARTLGLLHSEDPQTEKRFFEAEKGFVYHPTTRPPDHRSKSRCSIRMNQTR